MPSIPPTTQIMDIYTRTVDPETGEPAGKPRPISYAITGRNMKPAWSPDGKVLMARGVLLRDET